MKLMRYRKSIQSHSSDRSTQARDEAGISDGYREVLTRSSGRLAEASYFRCSNLDPVDCLDVDSREESRQAHVSHRGF
jgi:hypothetical protein